LFALSSFRDISIKRKLIFIIMFSSCIAAFMACTAFIINDLMTYRRSMEREVSILAQVIGSNSSAPLIFDDRKSAEETLLALSAQPHVVFASIYNQNGKEVARYVRSASDAGFIAPSPQGDSVVYADKHMHMFHRITLQGETIGTLYLKYDLEEISARRNQYLEIAFIILLAAFGLSMALSSRLQRIISSPVLHLADVAAAVSNSKNYSLRAEKSGQDEIGNLIDGLMRCLHRSRTGMPDWNSMLSAWRKKSSFELLSFGWPTKS